MVKKIKEGFENFTRKTLWGLGFIVGLIWPEVWLFIFLETLLWAAMLCQHINWEVFIIQFPGTLYVILHRKKDGK